jgi:hypothetical protein
MFMTASFMAVNKSRRSFVSRRNAMSEMSFSGSFSRGCSMSDFVKMEAVHECTNVTSDQDLDLILYGLCLSQQTFGNGEVLHAAWIADVVDVGFGKGLGALDEVVGVSSDVLALGLHCDSVSASLITCFAGT